VKRDATNDELENRNGVLKFHINHSRNPKEVSALEMTKKAMIRNKKK